MSKESVISTRLPKNEVNEIQKYAKEEDIDKSAMIKRLLHKSLEEYRVERAFKLYKQKKASLGEAAALAGKSMWDMIDLMKKHNTYLNYSVDDLREDMETLKGLRV
jgi:predicted HTH domain antitoxin